MPKRDRFVRAFLKQIEKKKRGYMTLDEAKRSRNYPALYQTAVRYRSG